MSQGDSNERKQAEEIMDQYLYSLGAGGAPQWITRVAVHRVRTHYFPSIEKAVKEGHEQHWDRNAPHVLDYVRAIGQLAGSYALSDGRHTIDEDDVKRAITVVETQYNEPEMAERADGEPITEGVWCPPPNG